MTRFLRCALGVLLMLALAACAQATPTPVPTAALIIAPTPVPTVYGSASGLLAYVKTKQTNSGLVQNLFIYNVWSNTETKLTENTQPVNKVQLAQPAWDEAGKRIAFVEKHNTSPQCEGSLCGSWNAEIMLVSAQGDSLQRPIPLPNQAKAAELIYETNPVFIGEKLLFLSNRQGLSDVYAWTQPVLFLSLIHI